MVISKATIPTGGFGFVSSTFLNPDGKVFFHIKKIKRNYLELAHKLDGNGAFEIINFWYEVETTEKGEQVGKLWLNAGNIPQSYTHELCNLIEKVESIWENVGSPKPSWLDLVTIELVGVDRRRELGIERDNLESQIRVAEENRLRAAEARREIEIKRIAKTYELTKLQATEFEQLIIEMRPLKFTHSKQLSNYIVKRKLGYKYPNISGILRMEGDGTQWDFRGGFSPDIYRKICVELGLSNEGTKATPIEFKSFKDIYQTNQEE